MKIAIALLALSCLPGCASDDASYPSLAPRAAEGRGFAEPAVAPPAPVVADPALDARLATLGGRLNTVVKGFDADAARAERAVAVRGAATPGSEAWVAAQSALAALDDWRAQAGEVATEVDAAARERAETAGTPYPPLDALRQRAEAETERQAAAIATLSARAPTR